MAASRCRPGTASIVLDSREMRARFELPEFTGQLFLHVVGAAGHDIVKYALDTFGTDDAACFSCTHDANSWPADFYAGLPAPDAGETRDAVGAEQPALRHPAPCRRPQSHGGRRGQAHRRRDPALRQLRARRGGPAARGALAAADRDPRRQVCGAAALRGDGARPAPHRACQCRAHRPRPDPRLPELGNLLGKGYLLPAPVLPRATWRTLALPTPMATSQQDLPVGLIVYDGSGREVARQRFGRLQRAQSVAVELDEMHQRRRSRRGIRPSRAALRFQRGRRGRRLAARPLPLRGPQQRARAPKPASARMCSTPC